MHAPLLSKLKTCAFSLLTALAPLAAHAQTNPDILVLGDSQISASGGPLYLDVFANLERDCNYTSQDRQILRRLGGQQVSALGISSASMRSWTSREGTHKDVICARNERFGVNAGAFGFGGLTGRQFVQIGEGRDYQLCEPNASPLESALRDGYYDPSLVIIALLGNDAGRWASSQQAARNDVRALMAQIPNDTACIMLTSAPVFETATNDLRMRAQQNLQRAFERENAQCAFVGGFSDQTRASIEGNPEHFARRPDGTIRDPLHPRRGAMQHFFNVNRPAICDAVITALR